MPLSAIIPDSFYNRLAVDVARDLLGMRLVRRLHGVRLSGIIVETEAYQGEEDLACHARAGRTARTAIMYGPPGRAYVYFTYGLHWMLNAVCLPEGQPAAVLVRAIQPLEGIEVIAAHRSQQPPARWTDGPAKICLALGIDGTHNGVDLTDHSGNLWIEWGEPAPDAQVRVGPRMGIERVPEPWRSMPWRMQWVMQN